MTRQDLMQIIKDYLLYNIFHKSGRIWYMGVGRRDPSDFYRPLRQWANIHQVSLLAEVAEQAMIVIKGEYMHPRDAEKILRTNN